MSPESATRLTKADQFNGDIAFVTAGLENQGVSNFICETEKMNKSSNCLSIDMFGNCFYRGYDFYFDDNIIVLKNESINKYCLIFIATLINQDSFRYSYGKQYRLKNLFKHSILLPTNDFGEPDYKYMEAYVKRLPFTKAF